MPFDPRDYDFDLLNAPPDWLSQFVRDELRPLIVRRRQDALDGLARYNARREEHERVLADWKERRRAFLRQNSARPRGQWAGQEPGEGVWVYGEIEAGQGPFGCWGPPELSVEGRPTVDDFPFPPPRNRDLSPDECWAALLVVHDEVRDPREGIGPADSIPYLAWRSRVTKLTEEHLPDLRAMLRTVSQSQSPTDETPKGKPGRRGYPLEALEYAKELRRANPNIKAARLRKLCLAKFSEDDLPPDADSFRRWLNRKRANRAN